jgi:transposase
VPVEVPTVAQEAARDLVRAREDVRGDLMRARHRTSKLLVRQGIVWSGGTAWTSAHHDWLRRQRFESSALALAYDSVLDTVLLTADRRDRLDRAIVELAADPAWSPTVTRLQCLRGISTLTAFGLAVEVGDWSRFTGSSIGAFLGLVPTEDSTGGSRRQGSITKTGNTHARRLLVEAAWHHKKPYHPSKALRDRWQQAPAAARSSQGEGRSVRHALLTGRPPYPVGTSSQAVRESRSGACQLQPAATR